MGATPCNHPDFRIRIRAEAEAAARLRAHPDEHLPAAVMLDIADAPLLGCGHLEGYEPADHLADPEACIAARQAHVDRLLEKLRRDASAPQF